MLLDIPLFRPIAEEKIRISFHHLFRILLSKEIVPLHSMIDILIELGNQTQSNQPIITESNANNEIARNQLVSPSSLPPTPPPSSRTSTPAIFTHSFIPIPALLPLVSNAPSTPPPPLLPITTTVHNVENFINNAEQITSTSEITPYDSFIKRLRVGNVDAKRV